MHNNVCITYIVVFVQCSERKSLLYVSDQKAWVDKIYRRFQSCCTDYNKISNRGKFGKSGQAQYKGLTALLKWKNECYSFLQPYYKQRQKILKESKTSSVLGGAAASTDHDSAKTLMMREVMRVAQATQGKTRLNNLLHH